MVNTLNEWWKIMKWVVANFVKVKGDKYSLFWQLLKRARSPTRRCMFCAIDESCRKADYLAYSFTIYTALENEVFYTKSVS